jgi:hypothetical protein
MWSFAKPITTSPSKIISPRYARILRRFSSIGKNRILSTLFRPIMAASTKKTKRSYEIVYGLTSCTPKKADAKKVLNSTLSDYMMTIFQDCHSSMDYRNPGFMDGFELTFHGTGYLLPGGHDELEHNLTK